MKSAVEIQNLNFAYKDESPLFKGLSWYVSESSFALLCGNTGSGKTTLLRLCVPTLDVVGVQSGTITLGQSAEPSEGGSAAHNQSANLEENFVAYVSQDIEGQLVCSTVWHELAFALENNGVPQELMHRRVAEVASFFGIEPWFHKKISELSGGQKQLVNVARMLALAPHIMLFDEPTAELDPIAEKNFLHMLFRINRELGITVIVATHAPELMASYATCAFELRSGQIESVSLEKFLSGQGDTQNTYQSCTQNTYQSCTQNAYQKAAENASANTSAIENASANTNASKSVPAYTNAIELKDVYARYHKKDTWVLRGFDIAVKQSEIHALVGGNGAGKSTALDIASGIISASQGRVCNTLRHAQAYMPQDVKALFVCDTVQEELCEWQSSCKYTNSEVDEILHEFNLLHCKNLHPFDLSGGQQQLLAFAKLVLTKPALFILDEPTKGLDARLKYLLAQKMLELSKSGATILFATHDLSFAYCVAHTTTMLFDGQQASSEESKAFFAHNLLYKPTENEFMRLMQKENA